MPAVAASIEKSDDQEKQEENGQNGKPFRRRWNAFLGFGGSRGQMFGARQVVLAEECFLVEAQITSDGAHEAVAEDAAGEPAPIFILEGFNETGADAWGFGEFVHGNFAHLALALQAFTKISLGHEPEPVLDESSGWPALQHPSPVRGGLRRRGISATNICRGRPF